MSTEKLLSSVRNDALSAIISIPKVMELSDSVPFSKNLSEAEIRYQNILNVCNNLHSDSGTLCLHPVSSNVLSELNNVRIADVSALAESVILIDTACAVELKRQLSGNPDAARSAKQLAIELLELNEAQIETMKTYL